MGSSENDWHDVSPTKPSAEHMIPGLYALARCWYDRGDYAPSEKIYRLIINIDDRVKNITCLEIVLSAYDLARLLTDTERYMEAEHMFLRAINRCTHCLSQDHKIFALILRSYGELLRKMKLEKEAVALETRAADLGAYATVDRKSDSTYTESDTAVSSATIG
ncbi:tetratricopeptide repeat protein [Candidatus Obscuribacterales bacterium]|nr:tetratricopeptide repeat protein [Candidatus Obscuribacterales bacterium]